MKWIFVAALTIAATTAAQANCTGRNAASLRCRYEYCHSKEEQWRRMGTLDPNWARACEALKQGQ